MKGFGGGREKSWGAKNKHSVIPGVGMIPRGKQNGE